MNLFIYVYKFTCIYIYTPTLWHAPGKIYFTYAKGKSYICVGNSKKKPHYVTVQETESIMHKEIINKIAAKVASDNLSAKDAKDMKQELLASSCLDLY